MSALCRNGLRLSLPFLLVVGLGTLPVHAADDGLADIAAWRQHHFGSADNTGNAANTADLDGDGVVNILEYALGMNPQVRGKAGLPVFGATSEGLTLTYERARTDIDYVVESSTDLVHWSADGVEQGGTDPGEVTAVAPFGSPSPVVLRLRVHEAISTTTGLRESAADALEFVVNTPSWADVHYRINGGAEVTVRMTQSDGQNTFLLDGLGEGDSVGYAFTYLADGEEVASDWMTHVFAGDFNAYTYTPLFSVATELEPVTQVETDEALYTYFSDRARDRHAREDHFEAYDHYLSHYWEHRTAEIEIVDEVAKGGDTITFNVRMSWKLKDGEAELRAFYRGVGTVAEYYDNKSMTPVDYHESEGPFFTHYPDDLSPPTADTRYYTRVFNTNIKESRSIQVGDRMEFELSQFLDNPPTGRDNYYGTTYLYIVGQGLVPWEAHGVFGDASTEREDSYPIDSQGWLGGGTTLPYMYSGEPDNHFMQMATNLAPVNGQRFVLGRRLHHTHFDDGTHSESANPSVDNPVFTEMIGKLGERYINRACVSCHDQNGRALPPEPGGLLDQYAVRVGDALGNPHPRLGAMLQPVSSNTVPEGKAFLASWTEADGLRTPNYTFQSTVPQTYSVRIAPQLVGMGLLEAIPESALEALADPEDENGDGISGRLHIVTDPETDSPRVGRFGWKATQPSVRAQVAAAFNTDMGVLTTVFPEADLGSQQSGAESGSELDEEHLVNLTTYISLLGVRAQRDLDDPLVIQGRVLFDSAKCSACHTPSFQTSPYHPHAELRDQTIQPYTDLLLHDMGPGLADNLAEGDAAGEEWRTPPLWGIGLTAGVSGGEAYLHDGRARTLEEAILWHDGEAAAAKAAYEAMSTEEKEALIAFLKSL